MRTHLLLKRDLARAEAKEVAGLAGVHVKTIKRILTHPNYVPRLNIAERLSSALDCVTLEPEAPKSAKKKAA